VLWRDHVRVAVVGASDLRRRDVALDQRRLDDVFGLCRRAADQPGRADERRPAFGDEEAELFLVVA
jgi:hypothetical protein